MLVPVAGRPEERRIGMPHGVHLSQRYAGPVRRWLIDEIPDGVILAEEKMQRIAWGLAGSADESTTVGRALRLSGGRVGRFGWKAQSASLADFVQPRVPANWASATPDGRSPPRSASPITERPGLDLTAQQCDQLTGYIASLSRPVERAPATTAEQMSARRRQADLPQRRLRRTVTLPTSGTSRASTATCCCTAWSGPQGGGSYNDPPRPSESGPGFRHAPR
jgi:hypothetical protein